MSLNHLRYFPVIIVIFFCSTKAFPQVKTSFLPGAYFDKDSVLHTGLVNDQHLDAIHSSFQFRQSATSPVQVIDLHSAIGFIIGKDTFELLTFRPSGQLEKDSVFAKRILRGYLSLYKYYKENEQMFILEKEGDTYHLKDDKLDDLRIQYYHYKEVTSAATLDCPNISTSNLGFYESAILKLVKQYNQCRNESFTLSSMGNEKKLNYLIASIMYMKFGERTESNYNLTWRIYMPRISKKASLNIGLNYSQLGFKSPNGLYKDTYYHLYSIPITIQLNLLPGDFRPYIFGGSGFGYLNHTEGGKQIINSAFGKNYGALLIVGGGLEWSFYKSFMLKSEYKFELYPHTVMVGLAYNFLDK